MMRAYLIKSRTNPVEFTVCVEENIEWRALYYTDTGIWKITNSDGYPIINNRAKNSAMDRCREAWERKHKKLLDGVIPTKQRWHPYGK